MAVALQSMFWPSLPESLKEAPSTVPAAFALWMLREAMVTSSVLWAMALPLRKRARVAMAVVNCILAVGFEGCLVVWKSEDLLRSS